MIISSKKLHALAIRLNATDAETLRNNEIIAMIRTSNREIIAINAGRSGAVEIKRIKRIGVQGDKALAEVEEVDNSSIPSELQPAVQAALKKADTYHCRYAVWVDSKAPQRYGPGTMEIGRASCRERV